MSIETFILVNCIWRYINCSGDSKILDGACSTNFKSCSNSLKEDEARDWKGLPLPNVSGLNIIDLDAGSENGKDGFLIDSLFIINPLFRFFHMYFEILQLFQHSKFVQTRVQYLSGSIYIPR